MRSMDLTQLRPQPHDPARLARLVRHLEARLGDFGPGGPQVCSADQHTGLVRARFPGHSAAEVSSGLAQRFGIQTRAEDGCVLFQLSADVPFENLDYVWGCLFALL